MPFRSKKQQRFMYATRPKGVDLSEWASKTDFSKLPEMARKKRKRKKQDKDDAVIEDCFRIPEVALEVLKEKREGDKDDVFQGPVSLESHGIDRILAMATQFAEYVGK